MKLKLYRVYLDRPGAGWEAVVKATNVRAAIKLACKNHGYSDWTNCVVGERVPDDFLIKRAKVDALRLERDGLIDKLARDYADSVRFLDAEYKIKIDNV
jgi:hypothetical protein